MDWQGTFSGLIPVGKRETELIALAAILDVEYTADINARCKLLDQGFCKGFTAELDKRT